MKKLISALLLAGVMLSNTAFVSAEASELPFKDVKADAWYYDYVKEAYDEGIMQGKSSDTFEPECEMTRAELVTVLCRLADEESEGKGEFLAFTDTSSTAWYADYVGWAKDKGIVTGYEDNTFRPDAPVKRDELAVFIGRFMTEEKMRTYNKPLIDEFEDVEQIPTWAKVHVDKLRKFGLVEGDNNGSFNPSSSATRAEISKIAGNLKSHVVLNDRYKVFDLREDFLYSEDSPEVPLPYRIYLPENYNENEEYPLLVYLHGNGGQGSDNKRHLGAAAKCFISPYSPAFDSIVVVPQCPENAWWHGEPIDRLAELMDYINERYSTDMRRQYVVGHSMGGDGTWQMLINYPEKVSAAVPVAGIGITFWNNSDGTYTPIGINDEMLRIPICMVYDNDDGFSDGDYNRMVYGMLKERGAENLIYFESSGDGHGICDHFLRINDISILEWLYAQERDVSEN